MEDFKQEIMDMLKELRAGQEKNILTINSVINSMKEELITQNNKLQESVEFISARYDGVLEQINEIKREHMEDRKYMKLLEDKIDYLEKRQRYASVELRNIPPV